MPAGDPSDPVLRALLTLHAGLPQQGLGSDTTTAEAIRRLPALPQPLRILDIDCGSGRQTLVLAPLLRGHVTAIDVHRLFLDWLRPGVYRGVG